MTMPPPHAIGMIIDVVISADDAKRLSEYIVAYGAACAAAAALLLGNAEAL